MTKKEIKFKTLFMSLINRRVEYITTKCAQKCFKGLTCRVNTSRSAKLHMQTKPIMAGYAR